MSTINSLLENSANSYKNLQSDAAKMASKWGKTGLLEGLGNEIEKNNMAMILENQAKQLVTEASATNQGGGTFTAGQGEQWAGVALPLVRKVFGSLSTKEFMSVQPMNLPSGLVFFLDFQYGQDKAIRLWSCWRCLWSLQLLCMVILTQVQELTLQVVFMEQVDLLTQSTNSQQSVNCYSLGSTAWAQVNYDSALSA